MKRIVVGMFFGLWFLVLGLYGTHAAACPDKGVRCMHEEGAHMMDGMSHHDMGMVAAEHMWGNLMGLNLDEKQKEEIKGIKSKMIKDAITKRATLDIVKIELKELLAKDPVDMKAVEAKLKQIAALQSEIHLSHIKSIEEVKSKLTTEQKKDFKKGTKLHSHPAPASKGMPSSCQGKAEGLLEMENKK